MRDIVTWYVKKIKSLMSDSLVMVGGIGNNSNSFVVCSMQCYCYVCDSAAPCKCWKTHCHASECAEDWKSQRKLMILKLRPRKL